MNYLKITKTDVANGKGVRVVLWLSGCTLHCKGCHNYESWDFTAGKKFDDAAKEELFNALSKAHIDGITFSGGHPLEYAIARDVYELIKEIKEKFPNKSIWLYTGLTWEMLMTSSKESYRYKIISMCDVIIDGSYIEGMRDLTLKFRGSSNQRIIDVKKSLSSNEIILYDK